MSILSKVRSIDPKAPYPAVVLAAVILGIILLAMNSFIVWVVVSGAFHYALTLNQAVGLGLLLTVAQGR